MSEEPPPKPGRGAAIDVLLAFLRLGLTSFGGPVAHLGYFRRAFVERRGWLDEAAYAELVALAQLLPGPASSQVGFALGLRRAGLLGGLAAFAGFTLPSAVLMVLFAHFAGRVLAVPGGEGLIHGLKLAAVAVVAQAVLAMARGLSRGPQRALLTLAGLVAALTLGGFAGQLLALAIGAAAGALVLRTAEPLAQSVIIAGAAPRRRAAICIVLFAALLALCPFMAQAGGPLDAFQAYYRSGALVFGGGHVVAPLLAEAVVEPGWVSREAFLQGYGAAQALPGPLFAFAAFLGAASSGAPRGLTGAVLATIAIFLPGLLLMAGALPFWSRLAAAPQARAALAGVNAAVVGVLAAALYDPIFTGSVRGPADLAVAAVALGLLVLAKAPPLVAVIFCAAGGVALNLV